MLMSETMEGCRNKFLKWREAFENGLKVNFGKTKMMVSGAALQRMACLTVKFTHVGSAA